MCSSQNDNDQNGLEDNLALFKWGRERASQEAWEREREREGEREYLGNTAFKKWLCDRWRNMQLFWW